MNSKKMRGSVLKEVQKVLWSQFFFPFSVCYIFLQMAFGFLNEIEEGIRPVV